MDLRGRARTCRGAAGTGWGTFPPRSMRATSNTDGSRRSDFASEPVAASLPGEWIGGLLSSGCSYNLPEIVRTGRAAVTFTGAGQQGFSAQRTSREPEEQSQDPSRATPQKRETNSLIDGPGPRATSGQGRAYSAARGDRDSPDRPAPSANNSPARCTISKPRRRNLTLHSKIARPSKCSYRLKCFRRSWFLVVHIPLVARTNTTLQTIDWPKSGFLALNHFRLIFRQMSWLMQPAPWTLALHSTGNSFYARSIWVRCDAQPRNTGAQF